jgi:hypothetical protein
MAPNFYDSTSTTSGHWGYVFPIDRSFTVYHTTRNGRESYEYQGTSAPEVFWSHQDKYEISYTQTAIYPNKEAEIKIKKLLKIMASALCKEGWIDHKYYYSEPLPIPVGLRGVRLEGRGWGNKK